MKSKGHIRMYITIPTLKVLLGLQGKTVASEVGREAGRVPRR